MNVEAPFAVGTKVKATRMGQDSFYKQVIGTVKYVRNGFVGIDATLVMSRWSKTFEPHPTSCATSARIEDVVVV